MDVQTQEVCNRVVAILKENFGENLVGVALFGSAARGDTSARSDVDIFAIIENLPAKHFRRCTMLNSLVLPRVQHRVTMVAKTKDEFLSAFPSLYLDLGLDGKILYDKEGFLSERLAMIRKIIHQSGLRREKRDYGFTWRWRNRPKRGWEITWEGYRELE